MALQTTTAAEIGRRRMGPRSRGLRENVEIEQVDIDMRGPRFGSVDTTKILEQPIYVNPDQDAQSFERDRAAKVDNLHRQAALVGRADDIRKQLAAAWADA